MGKVKRKSRSSKKRMNALPASDDLGKSSQDESLRTSKVLPIIAKLKSVIPNDKSMALGTISVMCEDTKLRQLFLKEKLLQILLEQCLNDSNSEIIVESFGLLRNIALEEGYDVCIYLWRQNIWKSIEVNFQKAITSFDAYSKDVKKFKKNESRLLFDYAENLISLTVALGDGDSAIFEGILSNIEPILRFVQQILEFSVDLKEGSLQIPISLFNAILSLIYDFSTESIDFLKLLQDQLNFNFEALFQLIPNSTFFNRLSKVYCQGIKLQYLEISCNFSNKEESVKDIVEYITNTIKDINIEDTRKSLISEVENATPTVVADNSKIRTEARADLEAIEIALELITAIVEITAFNLEQNNFKPNDVEQLFELLIRDVSELLISLLNYEEFKSRSLIALNNLSWLFITVSYNSEKWVNTSVRLWSIMVSLLASATLEDKISIFGVLWANSIVLADRTPVDLEFIRAVIQEFQNVSNSEDSENEVREELLIRVIGFLSSIAKLENPVSNSEISLFLFKILNSLPNVPPKLVVEILDQLYEIYGDAEFAYDEPVFVHNQYLQQLKALIPKVKASFRLIDKNVDPTLKSRANSVFVNLERFIDYKEKERGS